MANSAASNRHKNPASLARLPLPLVESIVDFAVVDVADDIPRTKELPFGCVSKEWHSYERAISSARAMRTLTIDSIDLSRVSSSHAGLHALRDEMLGRVELRELRIEVSEESTISTGSCITIFGAAPLLETLHLVLDSTANCVVSVIRAAMEMCPRVQSLTISHRSILLPHVTEEDVDAMLAQLLQALECWKRHGGLRELNVAIPFLRLPNHASKATQFVQALATHCPNLQYVGNREHPAQLINQWYIGIEAWEQFCASCTELTDFHWGNVPFTTSFFKAFGRHVKPKLKRLTLEYANYWDWDAYHRRYPPLPSGFGAAAQNPQTVLSACSVLRELRIVCPAVDAISDDGVFNQSLLSEVFCAVLATSCPKLERLTVFGGNAELIGTLTDKAMLALATLPALMCVSISNMALTGEGLWELIVNSMRRHWTPQREYTITLGDDVETFSAQAFYEVALQFLTRLSFEGQTRGPLTRPSDRVLLRLLNNKRGSVEYEGWFATYWAQFMSLVSELKHQHPHVRLRVVVGTSPRYDEDTASLVIGELEVDSIAELDFYTVGTKLPVDNDGWSTGSDVQIDDVFVHRRADNIDRNEDSMPYDDDSDESDELYQYFHRHEY